MIYFLSVKYFILKVEHKIVDRSLLYNRVFVFSSLKVVESFSFLICEFETWKVFILEKGMKAAR